MQAIAEFAVKLFAAWVVIVFIIAMWYMIRDWSRGRQKPKQSHPVIEDFEKHYNEN